MIAQDVRCSIRVCAVRDSVHQPTRFSSDAHMLKDVVCPRLHLRRWVWYVLPSIAAVLFWYSLIVTLIHLLPAVRNLELTASKCR